jgi:PEGA domain-containing protein
MNKIAKVFNRFTQPVWKSAVLTLLFLLSASGGATLNIASGAQDKPSGSIRVKTDASDVQVFLDDAEVGRTPLTLKLVTAGTYRLTLLKQGYEDHTEQVEVSPEKTASVFVVMKPLSGKLPELPAHFKAMHQHRLGYCVGVLTVTAEALDYKSEKNDDVFHLPIRDLKSVSRSWGPVPGVTPVGINSSTDAMAVRVEATGRAYGFLAFKETTADPMSVAAARTKELYELVYSLWSASLKPSEK